MNDLDKLIALLVKQGLYVNAAHFAIQHPKVEWPTRYRWWRAGKNANGRRVRMCFLDNSWCGHHFVWQETVMLKKKLRWRISYVETHKKGYDLCERRAKAYSCKYSGVFDSTTPIGTEDNEREY